MTARSRKALGWTLAIIFAIAITVGAGPGVLLVNEPRTIDLLGLRVPWLYAWAVFWYGVEATCVVLAYLLVWRDPADPGAGE